MLKRSEWIIDARSLHTGRGNYSKTFDWEDWKDAKSRSKEHWLMSIIETLMSNNNWSGALLLINTYISNVKAGEGTRFYNRTPYDESVRVRAMRQWFWMLVEEYGFAEPEEEIRYEDRNTPARRAIDKAAQESYPFVGGKPKRRYSESSEFFRSVAEDRKKEREQVLGYRNDKKARSKQE